VVAVAASHQRTPARRLLPVAADTRRLWQCPRWTSPSGHRRGCANIADTEHCGSRPVGRTGHGGSLPRTAPRTGRPPQPGGGHYGRPRACCGGPAATPEAGRSAHLCWSTRPDRREREDSSVRPARTPDESSGHPQFRLTWRSGGPRTAAGCRGHCGSRPAGQQNAGGVRRDHHRTVSVHSPGAVPSASRDSAATSACERCCPTTADRAARAGPTILGTGQQPDVGSRGSALAGRRSERGG
jgi:hypothetical protein